MKPGPESDRREVLWTRAAMIVDEWRCKSITNGENALLSDGDLVRRIAQALEEVSKA